MKKVLLILVAIISTVMWTNAKAEMNPDVKIYATGIKSFILQSTETISNPLLVTIRDLRGEIVHSERVELDDELNRKYNLKNLPNGQYIVSMDNGSQISTQGLNIQGDVLTINEDDYTTFFQPVIMRNGEKVDINMLALTPTQITVSIVDYAGRVNYKETVTVDGQFGKRFDISNLENGQYNISVRVNNTGSTRVFDKSFIVSDK